MNKKVVLLVLVFVLSFTAVSAQEEDEVISLPILEIDTDWDEPITYWHSPRSTQNLQVSWPENTTIGLIPVSQGTTLTNESTVGSIELLGEFRTNIWLYQVFPENGHMPTSFDVFGTLSRPDEYLQGFDEADILPETHPLLRCRLPLANNQYDTMRGEPFFGWLSLAEYHFEGVISWYQPQPQYYDSFYVYISREGEYHVDFVRVNEATRRSYSQIWQISIGENSLGNLICFPELAFETYNDQEQ